MTTLVPPQDALFLLGESRENPTHVTALQILRPPADAGEDWLDELYATLVDPTDLKSAFARRPVRSLTTAGAWAWEPDEDLDLASHVRRTALPAPGRVRELLEHVSALHARLLDRSRPLWEAELVTGLADGRFALVTKLHHSLFDGITLSRHIVSGLAFDPETRGCRPPWRRSTTRPRRSSGEEDGGTVGDLIRSAAGMAGGVVGGLPALARALAQVATGDVGVAFQAPHTRLNERLSGQRRFAGESWPYARLADVAKRHEVTVNDVGLAMSSGALRAYLDDLGELPPSSLVAMVPVSLRGTDTRGEATQGNAWGSVFCVLGTDLADPADRLAKVHASMTQGKAALRSLDPVTSVALNVATMGLAALPTLRMLPMPPRPVVNLIISNVPSTEERQYFDGAEVTDNYPVSMVADGQALNITLVRYADEMAFGLTGCPRAVPHLQRLLGHLDTALVELESIQP
ncbi:MULTISPECIES: WS/DGAT/MGAT family O-acyltransferase [Actinomycetospora]|uniref:WS/DGAT/MGAT family O-acyltransferase n=1 Tax=Actinomycetospora TaxID=402649 RepID=UPI001E37F30E|nr:wax ester/triacylglycerol synthase family O-acyltransferase [Actinomycetospora soli]MCD2189499.1 wax ester/triacylglycerol synthase family O-acyltransferase [Actinomycetospora soli]